MGYPVSGSEIANRRYFLGELGDHDAARAADAELTEATRRFNEEIAGGKWRGMMTLEPADQQFKSMRIYPWQPPPLQPNLVKTGTTWFGKLTGGATATLSTVSASDASWPAWLTTSRAAPSATGETSPSAVASATPGGSQR